MKPLNSPREMVKKLTISEDKRLIINARINRVLEASIGYTAGFNAIEK